MPDKKPALKKSEKKSGNNSENDLSVVDDRRLKDIQDYGDKKKALQKRNNTVRSPIPRITSELVRTSVGSGRKKKYTPTRMKNEINKYFEWCEEQDEIPSIKGLMIHLNMYKDMFYRYRDYPQFTAIMEHTQLIIKNWCENDVYKTPGQAAGKLRYMQNIHDWTEKIETKNQTEVRTISVDEARSKIEMLAPKLLELLGKPDLLKQLASREQTVEAEVVKEDR
jgi:hypothetical protein